MGCSNSKLNDLPAVALCRARCAFLEEAIQFRYALAEAHVAYVHSLKSVGLSLHNFIKQGVVVSSGSPPRKNDYPVGTTKALKSPHHLLPRSDSGSHLHFCSDSDDESDSFHHPDHYTDGFPSFYGGNGGFMQMNYMKNKATPSVVYEQRAIPSEKVYHMGESSSSTSSFPHNPYSYSNLNSNPYSDDGYSNYGGGIGGYYSSLPPPPSYESLSNEQTPAKPPPPPPSPPRPSAWDYLNLFETFDNFYGAYTPNRDSKEVRMEEGIPDLEEEDFQKEVVKEVHGNKKFIDGGGNQIKLVANDEVKVADKVNAALFNARPSASADSHDIEYEVHFVDKKVVDDKERSEDHVNGAGGGSMGVYDVAREVKVQFEKASEAGIELCKLLEVGKLPYQQHKHVSSKMLHAISPSSLVESTVKSSSSIVKPGSAEVKLAEDTGIKFGSLSSILHKLHLWEMKLYDEVKAEEKMRVLHDKKSRKLKRLVERGAEAQKIESTQSLIRSLSTKIRIAIQVVDKMSVAINKTREDELWPLLNELIQGLTRMWRSMLECHRTQLRAIREARIFGPSGSGRKLGDTLFGATLELGYELINWTCRLSRWVSAQKGYVRNLNNWLMKCLLYEPEETDDGIAPFSPSRIGAPPIFVICNQWSQAIERISEKEVIDSMHVFATEVVRIWRREKTERREGMVGKKDMEGRVRNLDREDQKVQKEIQALEKSLALVSIDGNGVYPSDTSDGGLDKSMERVFETMERFTEESMEVYDKLLKRCEEQRLK